MAHLWISVLAVILLRSGRAAGEHLREQDETTCTNEACGPYPFPIPIPQRKSVPDETVPGSQESYGTKLEADEEIKTSFSCNDKPYIPGFYANMETECRIFHLCLASEVDHFLCPPETAFNQTDLVCKPSREVDCHLSPTFYHLNRRLVTGPSTTSETKASVMKGDKWLLDLLKGEEPGNATLEDILELNLIRMFILMELTDLPDLLADLNLKDSKDNASGSSMNSSHVDAVIKRVFQEVFPLLPLRFGTEPRSRPLTHKVLKGARDLVSNHKHKSESSSWHSLWENAEVSQEEKSPARHPLEIAEETSVGRRPLDLSVERAELSTARGERNPRRVILSLFGSRKQAVEIAKAILDVIGTVAGSISGLARDEVVSVYVNYINSLLHEGLKEST